MRRTTPFLAAGLVVVGLELSTQVASLTLVRLSSGFHSMRAGFGYLVSPTRFVVGVSLLAIGLFAFVAQMILESAEGRVSAVGDVCPVCRGDTERMKRLRMHRILSTFMGRRLTRRRCNACKWTGLSVKY